MPRSLVGNPRRRARVLFVAAAFVLSIFAAQTFRIQGIDSAAVAAQALWEREGRGRPVPAVRGEILDANGAVLASSVAKRTVTVDQTTVCTYETKKSTCAPDTAPSAVGRAAEQLAPLLGMPVDAVVMKLTGTAQYNIVATNVSVLAWRRIAALGIPGIYSEQTMTRVYPTTTAAASLVGYLLDNDQGGGGIEYQLNGVLAGRGGWDKSELSAGGTVIPDGQQDITAAVPGRNVQLTINADLQWYAQNALAQKIQEVQALSGTAVVMNAKTGQLLAVASYPTFDPSNLSRAGAWLSNQAFSDVFEPGSTAKVMTMAAALSEGKATPTTPVIVPNQLHRSDTWFHDAESHGTEYLTTAGALAQSSNMGLILIGETMSAQTLERYFHKFGLGSTSGSGFPGESPGILAPVDKWSGSQRYTVMFGQGLSVTAIQAASVFQTIADGGVRMAPRLVQSVEDTTGAMVPQPTAPGVRVIPAKAAEQLSQMLEGVVSVEGTAPLAKIPGYRVAGKTGTANRIAANGRYSGYTASFIGYAPADDPQLVVAVIVQRPVKGTYGGIVAAPVFRSIMTYALQLLKIPPTGTKPPTLELNAPASTSINDPAVLADRQP